MNPSVDKSKIQSFFPQPSWFPSNYFLPRVRFKEFPKDQKISRDWYFYVSYFVSTLVKCRESEQVLEVAQG